MKKYNYLLAIRIFWIIFFSFFLGVMFAFEKYWIVIACVIALIISTLYLIKFIKQTVKGINRMISSIQFNELNVSFNSFTQKGLSPQLVLNMGNAINQFNKQQHKLESMLRFYEILLENIDFAILVIDSSGKIEWINKAAVKLFGKTKPRKLYDLAKVSLTLPDELDLLIPKETKIIRFFNKKQQVQVAATMLSFSLNGRNLKLISLKNIESVLFENESDAWKKLIRILTHEIMNSLSPIISLSETFSETDEERIEFMPKAMQTIHRRSKGLIDFVNNYQKLTKIPPPSKTIFTIKELLEDISNLLKVERMLFSYTIGKENWTLNADRAQIEQVMINLIKNAYESASLNTSVKVHINVSKDYYQRTFIRVIDNGDGILPDVLDKIFVPFFTTKSTGSGVGLSICQQIINLHGGSIAIKSKPEDGTTVSIIL
ncbi:two-component system nitrogen regulation sensor histidine kinase NtrY [Dysgonomonadaceae bacterium PH5-43]|nr:two-component system nitrogen regulation sensor histidine kinase NtrY [Dysgonomonadaceae bacterium PH5-43]